MIRKWFQRTLPALGWILAFLLLANGGLPGAYSKPAKQPTGNTSFKSGAQRGEEVLREMLIVLKRIDSRIERIEKSDKDRGN